MTARGPGTRDQGSGLGEGSGGVDERDTPMTGTYVAVVIVEALVIILLWILGRIYA